MLDIDRPPGANWTNPWKVALWRNDVLIGGYVYRTSEEGDVVQRTGNTLQFDGGTGELVHEYRNPKPSTESLEGFGTAFVVAGDDLIVQGQYGDVVHPQDELHVFDLYTDKLRQNIAAPANTVYFAPLLGSDAGFLATSRPEGQEAATNLHVFRRAEVDLRIDSNNDGTTDAADNATEDDPTKPGKLIGVDDGDIDGNAVPDFAQFGAIAGGHFAAMLLEVPDTIDLSTTTFKLGYDDSPPEGVSGAGTAQDPYIAAPGALRVWTKDGSVARNGSTIADGGDWWQDGGEYTAAQLGLTNTNRSVTLYVEAASPSATLGQQRIALTIDPDGAGPAGQVVGDALRLTAFDALIRVDANRDGTINFNESNAAASDRTTLDDPYQFWTNDNEDYFDGTHAEYYELGPDDSAFHPDWQTGRINNVRDLEDFSRMRIQPPTGFDPRDDSWDAKLSLDSEDTSMIIKLFLVSEDEANQYLTDSTVASGLVNKGENFQLSAGDSHTFSAIFFTAPGNATSPLDLLFEGAAPGTGKVRIEFDKSGTKVAEDSFDLKLRPAHLMYETYAIGNSDISNDWIGDVSSIATTPATLVNLYTPHTDADRSTDDYILFVHGWRMNGSDKRIFADTAYKRLFWQGYKGKFGALDWPTEWIDNSNAGGAPWQWGTDREISENFARSEEQAWYSGAPLKSLLETLYSKYHDSGGNSRVNLLSHSMGAVVASEALEQYAAAHPGGTPIVKTYIASQGATWAESYDGSDSAAQYGGDEYHWLKYQTDHGHTFGTGYFSNLGSAAAHLANFYNPVDYAPGKEFTHNGLAKSNFNLGGYSRSGFDDFVFKGPDGATLDNWADRYAILAFASQALTRGIGASANVGGPFDQSKQVDLQATFGFTNAEWDHSAEFNSTNVLRYRYWKTVLQTMGLSA